MRGSSVAGPCANTSSTSTAHVIELNLFLPVVVCRAHDNVHGTVAAAGMGGEGGYCERSTNWFSFLSRLQK